MIDAAVLVRDEDLRRLAQYIEPIRIDRDKPYSEDELIAVLQGFAGVIRLGGLIPELTRRVFAQLPDLRIAGVRGDRFGTGVDLVAAAEHDVRIIDTDNIGSAHPVAEWDLAMILICLRNAGAVYRQMMTGEETWANAGNEEFVSGELTERRVGLIGCGHVGQRLIELMQPFRVLTLATFPNHASRDCNLQSHRSDPKKPSQQLSSFFANIRSFRQALVRREPTVSNTRSVHWV